MQRMFGNSFFKVLALAAPAVASFVAIDGFQPPVAQNLSSNIEIVEAGVKATVAQLDAQGAPSVPVQIVAKNEDGKLEEQTLEVQLQANIVETIKGNFKSDAPMVLRSVEEALLNATKSVDSEIREASSEVLPLVQSAVPYKVNPGIKIPAKIEKKVAKIAEATYRKTGKKIVVTSAARTPKSQAAAMKTKLDLGESPRRLYSNKRAASEIENAYLWARKTGLSADQVVNTMAMVIQRQIDNGTYISRHLRQGAVDLRSRDLSAAQKSTVRYVAKSMGAKVLLESTPPHFHLEIL